MTEANATPLPELGWFVCCLRASDVPASVAFYEKLGFVRVGGNPEQGWAQLALGNVELALMSFLKRDLINMRGGDVPAIAKTLAGRGCQAFHIPGMDPTNLDAKVEGYRAYDPSKWPAEFHTGEDGKELDLDSSGDCLVGDPDGHHVYFDTTPLERARFITGAVHGSQDVAGADKDADIDFAEVELPVSDVAKARAHYEHLDIGFVAEDSDATVLGGSGRKPARIRLAHSDDVDSQAPWHLHLWARVATADSESQVETDPDGRQITFHR